MRNELISLVTRTGRTRNANGFSVDTEALTEVFAQVKSVRATEFYQAYVAGLNLALIFVVDADDYKTAYKTVDDKTVKPWAVDYDDARYKITRIYRTDMGLLELTCEESDHGNDL